METTEIGRITRQLAKTFDQFPWYGSSIMSTLGKVKPQDAFTKLGEGHSIIELVLHMTSWRKFAVHRLQGDNGYEVSEQQNFPRPGMWEEALKGLEESQKELLAAAAAFPPERLNELVPSKTQKYTYYTLLHGITQHDVYHLGQIAYINRSVGQ